MPDTTGQRRRVIVAALSITFGLSIATSASDTAQAAPNTHVIRPPQQATATTRPAKPAASKATASKPSAAKPATTRPAPTTGARRINIPSAARRGMMSAPRAVAPPLPAAEEAKPFAIDPARPLEDQIAAVGISRDDAQAAAKTVASLLKGATLGVGHTGRAALVADGTPADGARLQSLQIFGPGGVVADIARGPDGAFAGKTLAAAAGQKPQAGSTEDSPGNATEDDPRAWSSEGWSPRVSRTTRSVTQATVGMRRVSANGDPNIALAKAGVDSPTARHAALALAAVAPASLDRRTANIELVHGRTGDGRLRLLTATIYDRSSRGQIWWFAPKDQPEGFFDQHGNRVGDSAMVLPIEGSHISSPFGTRRWGRWAAFHNGIDVAGRYGTPILAAADGVVDYAGWYYNYGKTVRVVHSDSLATSYSHMSSFAPGIGPGTHVHKGQLIGYVGSTGRSTGPHLHFCVLVDGRFVNPAPYVAGGGGRLGPQDLVAFRDWQRTTAGLARGASSATGTASEPDGYNRL